MRCEFIAVTNTREEPIKPGSGLLGKLLGSAAHAIAMNRPKPDFVEQDSENIWQSVCQSVHDALAKSNVAADQVAAIGFDATAFYTYFNNKIIADYDTDANKIIYDNLDGHAVSQGISLNMDVVFNNGLKMLVGATAMDVYSVEEGERIRQLFTEKFTGTWNIGYTIKDWDLTIDYTGNLYGPMRLPLLSEMDPRREYSPWWSIQNIQLTKVFDNGIEIYGGVKNLLNWTPNRGNPFIIARANDPFDNNVVFDENGQAVPTPDNPYGLTFDPSYVYGPNQGIRGFLGMRYSLF